MHLMTGKLNLNNVIRAVIDRPFLHPNPRFAAPLCSALSRFIAQWVKGYKKKFKIKRIYYSTRRQLRCILVGCLRQEPQKQTAKYS